MKKVIKSNGQVVATLKVRNEMHFDVQRKTRSTQVLSEKEKTRNCRSKRKQQIAKEVKKY